MDRGLLAAWIGGRLPKEHPARTIGEYGILAAADMVNPCVDKAEQWGFVCMAEAMMLDCLASIGDTLSDLERGPIENDGDECVGWICNLFISGKHRHFEGKSRYAAVRSACEAVAEQEPTR